MQKTIVITDHGFSGIDQERKIIEKSGHHIIEAACKTEEEVLTFADIADALLVQWAPVTRKVISQLKTCQVIVRYGIGVDNIDLEAAREYGIPVCNVPDYCIEEVATHTMALSLALQRRVSATDLRVRNRIWKIIPPGSIQPCTESTFTVLGFGRIARSVIGKARVFGFRIAACDPNVSKETMDELGVEKVSFETALNTADILSLHLPLNSETRHCINSVTLDQMKSGALLINTSRGGLVDTADLAQALVAGRIAGAGLDVFEKEPLEEDHPLRTAPNTLLTSHTAWYSERSIPLLQKLAAEEVARVLAGYPPKNRLV